MAAHQLRIVVVDDHVLVRKGLAALINHAPDMVVCGEAGNVEDGLAGITRHRPDVAVIDLTLGHESGLDLVRALSTSRPEVQVLVLSMHDEGLHAERSVAAGARGYIMKDEARQDLLDAIRIVARGVTYLSPRMQARVLARVTTRHGTTVAGATDTLTGDEQRVFTLLGQGATLDAIAAQFDLPADTIASSCERISKKLGLLSEAELVRVAMSWQGARAAEPPSE